MRMLFLTWDGPATSYHESLFLPILSRLREDDDHVHLLQYAWEAEDRAERIHGLAQQLGMDYALRLVRRRTLALLLPVHILRGAIEVATLVRRHRINLIMARSAVPAAMTLLAMRLFRVQSSFVYDADGLPADERVEFGSWRRDGMRYRTFRWLERHAVRCADVVLVRAMQASAILQKRSDVSRDKFHVVVNGKDADQFTPGEAEARGRMRASLAVAPDAPVVVYAGSIGPQYQLEQMLQLFSRISEMRADARLLVLTPQRYHKAVQALASGAVGRSLLLLEAAAAEVPSYLAAGDLGLALRATTTSQRAVAPIKVGEYLLCGTPVAYTPGIGDLDTVLRGKEVGYPVVGGAGFGSAASWLIDEVLPNRETYRQSCRQLGLAHFSLEQAVLSYRRALDKIDLRR